MVLLPFTVVRDFAAVVLWPMMDSLEVGQTSWVAFPLASLVALDACLAAFLVASYPLAFGAVRIQLVAAQRSYLVVVPKMDFVQFYRL